MPKAAISPDGRQFDSRFRSSLASAWSPPTSARFASLKVNEGPGPAQYKPRIDLSTTGQYFYSSYKSS